MATHFEQVLRWHERAAPEQINNQLFPWVTPEQAEHRLALIEEEVAELRAAIEDGDEHGDIDYIGIADALADIEYTVLGTYLMYGMNGDAVFNEVHISNMSKIGPKGEVEKLPGGKVLKGKYYKPPLIARALTRKIK